MNATVRLWFRTIVCFIFVVSFYGGMILLTAAMFAKGMIILGVLSGLVLSAMTAMALGLIGLAWSLTNVGEEIDNPELLAQPG